MTEEAGIGALKCARVLEAVGRAVTAEGRAVAHVGVTGGKDEVGGAIADDLFDILKEAALEQTGTLAFDGVARDARPDAVDSVEDGVLTKSGSTTGCGLYVVVCGKRLVWY